MCNIKDITLLYDEDNWRLPLLYFSYLVRQFGRSWLKTVGQFLAEVDIHRAIFVRVSDNYLSFCRININGPVFFRHVA